MKRLLIAGVLLLVLVPGFAWAAGCATCVEPVAPDSVLAYADPVEGDFCQEFVGWIDGGETFYPLISPRQFTLYESALPDSGGGGSKYLIDQVNCLVRHAEVSILTNSATVYAIPPMWYSWADTTHFGVPIDDSKAYLYKAEFDGFIYGLRIETTAESVKVRVRFWN